MNNALFSGLLKTSAVCFLVSMQNILIFFFCMNIWKLWYLIVMCFIIGETLFCSATAMKIWSYLNTLQNTSGFGRWISEINDTYFIRTIKGITLPIAWLNKIYIASVIPKVISLCNSIHHNTGHPLCVIKYPICNMTLSASLEPAWYNPPGNSISAWHLIPFSLLGL